MTLLATRWIERALGPVPIEFQKLIDATVDDEALRAAIDALLAEKRQGAELDYGPADPILAGFIEGELALRESQTQRADPAPSVAALDELFRETLRTAWPGR